MSDSVAAEYGSALWSLASDEGCTEALYADSGTVLEVLRDNPDYIKLICCPDLHVEERIGILHEAFSGSVHAYMLNFLKLLTEKRRFSFVQECLCEYQRLWDEANGIENVVVYSAVELSDSQKEQLIVKLSEKLNKNIRLRTLVDPALIGGIRVETKELLLDGSVRAKIETIRDNLINKVI